MRFITRTIAGLGVVAGTCLALGVAAAATTVPSSRVTSASIGEVRHPVPLHRVAVLQEALDSTGAHLKIDGIWGPATEAALRHYQRQNALPVTGELDNATRSWLAPIG